MIEATLELRINSYRTAISCIDDFMSKFEKKDKEVKECRWYQHMINQDVLGDAMKDIYNCHKCREGKNIKCQGYEPYKEIPLT